MEHWSTWKDVFCLRTCLMRRMIVISWMASTYCFKSFFSLMKAIGEAMRCDNLSGWKSSSNQRYNSCSSPNTHGTTLFFTFEHKITSSLSDGTLTHKQNTNEFFGERGASGRFLERQQGWQSLLLFLSWVVQLDECVNAAARWSDRHGKCCAQNSWRQSKEMKDIISSNRLERDALLERIRRVKTYLESSSVVKFFRCSRVKTYRRCNVAAWYKMLPDFQNTSASFE